MLSRSEVAPREGSANGIEAVALAPVPVLIVDDRTEDLRAIADLLNDPAYRIFTASSGSEALRLVLANDFAVVLLDVFMPIMDGFELAQLIKQRERSRHTPLLFLTSANQDVSIIYRAYSVGAVDYLSKPIDPAVVRAKVAIFADMYRKDRQIEAQAQALLEADRRERELQLAEVRLLSERRYRSLVEMIPASVWTADADGAVDYCNHHFHEVTGLRTEQAQGDGWIEAIHPDDAERIRAAWQSSLETGGSMSEEMRLRLADGTYRWHLLRAVPEPARARRSKGWLGTFTDCEDLKRAVEARDEFLSIASHELRTPITTLLLQLEAIQRRVGQDDRVGPRIESAQNQVQRLDSLVESLLDVGRICSGRLEIVPEELDLAEIVRQVVERFNPQIVRAKVSLRLEAVDGLRGRWDKLRLEQAATNLLSNALKYGAGKPIEITVDRIERDARLTVRDYGIGIPPEHQARIFDRFERAVSARHFTGLGMGLYITRQIVVAHAGSLAVQSKPGEGSTFTIRFPLLDGGPA